MLLRRTAAPLIVAVLLLSRCHDGCETDFHHAERSPAKTLKAVRFTRSCGMQQTTEVSIVGRWAPTSGAGNAFACEAPDEQVIVSWETEHRLRISYPATARVFRREASVRGVTIRAVAR